jgi:hypothetical protein
MALIPNAMADSRLLLILFQIKYWYYMFMCRSGSSFHLLETMIALPFLLSLVGYAYELYLRHLSDLGFETHQNGLPELVNML